jgi:hypothetical protein
MVKRLKDASGFVYGWNHEMAKNPDLTEFDDEDENAQFEPTAKTPDVRGQQPPVMMPTIVGDLPQDQAAREAAAVALATSAATEGQAALDDGVTPEVTPADEDAGYIMVDENGDPILDANGNEIPSDADGNPLDPNYPRASDVPVEEEVVPEAPASKKGRK